MKEKKGSAYAMSMPGGLTLGGCSAMLMTLLLSGILAELVAHEVIPEDGIGWGIMGILVLSGFTGAMAAWIKIKHRKLLVCMGAGAVYMGLLLCVTALFFGGQYDAVWETGLLILAGAGAAAVLGPLPGRRTSGKGRKIRA